MSTNSIKAWLMKAMMLGAALFLPAETNAQHWLTNGETSAEQESQASDGTLGIWQVLTTKPNEFLYNWEQPTEGVKITTSKQVSRGHPIVSFVLFSGCTVDVSNNCNLVISYRALNPSGEEYAFYDYSEMWQGKPAPAQGQLQLSVFYMGLIIEPKDELGEYQIQATVRDLNSGSELVVTERFIAVE